MTTSHRDQARNPGRRGEFEWQQVSWSDTPVMTRGSWGGLPALGWGWADPAVLATYRQLAAQGLRPGGQAPAAVVLFGHRDQPYWRRADHALLYQVVKALPKREPTPAQRAAIDKALAARRTCRECGDEQSYYLSTVSRMCSPCEQASDFWAVEYEQRFGPDTAANPAGDLATAADAGQRCAAAVEHARAAVERLSDHESDPVGYRARYPASEHADGSADDHDMTAREVA